MQSNKFSHLVGQLIGLLSGLDQSTLDLDQRRLHLISELAEWIDAKAGFWGWGRGSRAQSAISPIVSIPIGFNDKKWAAMSHMALSPESDRLFNAPIRQRLASSSHVTVCRSLIWERDAWSQDPVVQQAFHAEGLDEWLVSVRYFQSDSWINLTYFRELGKPEFDADDCALVHLVLGHVGWMRPRVTESIPPKSFVGLTHRQRTVMLLLLEGHSRKEIASKLGVSLHTVNDHCKEIYSRFAVNSATELAAKFLKST